MGKGGWDNKEGSVCFVLPGNKPPFTFLYPAISLKAFAQMYHPLYEHQCLFIPLVCVYFFVAFWTAFLELRDEADIASASMELIICGQWYKSSEEQGLSAQWKLAGKSDRAMALIFRSWLGFVRLGRRRKWFLRDRKSHLKSYWRAGQHVRVIDHIKSSWYNTAIHECVKPNDLGGPQIMKGL